jgi:2-oxo-3-hexenedioate decarboxylase
MAIDRKQIRDLAARLQSARLSRRAIGKISDGLTDFTLDDAYLIQETGVVLRYARGEKLVGLKMGLTSEAKRKQMGLHSPVFGHLTDAMQVPAGGTVRVSAGIHPKIEPEIAFHVSHELRGKLTEREALEACHGVSIALEIIDSRYEGFKYFSLEDVVADNSSSFLFAVGPARVDFKDLDLAALTMVMKADGKEVARGGSDAISGSPVRSLVQLAELVADRGQSVPAGAIVLAGAALPAIPFTPGMTVSLEVEGFPALSVRAEA